MANIRYLNQQNPFWDWASQFDSNIPNHPFFNAYTSNPGAARGPAPQNDASAPSNNEAPPPPNQEGPGSPPHDIPGANFPFGGRHGGPNHRGGPHGHHGGRGGCGPRGRGGRCGGAAFGGAPFDMNKIADFISQFVPNEAQSGGSASKDSKDFTPSADIFDTEDAYVVHVSLPGAKKEDVGVNWDADKSELNVAGVIYRPGDEEFLKTLALDERKVGVFERTGRLGSKERPAQVDADGIGPKMEEGVLVVTIPKTDADIVEVKKVDIE